jgi:archaellum component FlaC
MRKNIPQLKNKVSGIKTSLDRVSNRLEMVEKRVNDLANRSKEIIQS